MIRGVQGNDLMRILKIAAFAVSGYASTEGRQCKPFNPLLGETYEADYPDKGLRFFSEKVMVLLKLNIAFDIYKRVFSFLAGCFSCWKYCLITTLWFCI